MISKVGLKNWKSHLESEFKFGQGVNALVGINGAGKSSVLDSISSDLDSIDANLRNIENAQANTQKIIEVLDLATIAVSFLKAWDINRA